MSLHICKWCGTEYKESLLEDFCDDICKDEYDSDMINCRNEWEEEREKERNEVFEEENDNPIDRYINDERDNHYFETEPDFPYDP
jgi:hypothetical protein